MRTLLLLCTLLLCYQEAHAQHAVAGRVTDEAGEALFGVNISEKGTLNGTTTDTDGRYRLDVLSPEATLVFSYIGYERQEIGVGGRNEIDVTLVEGVALGEVQIVGSRSYNRSATDSPVAVDVIDVADLASATGKIEINQILQYAAPSFNSTKQSGSDGADHIDPASLRGLGPDQTLVLVNGKRRHQSSLVNIFGTRGRGNTGTDLNAIPASAIKRIEILRDGAAAQYGSDAIAGVINIVLKDGADGLTAGVTRGAYSTAIGEGYARETGETIFNVEGENRLDGDSRAFDGTTTRVDVNYGLALGDAGGFANVTAEYLTRDRTLRPGFPWRQGYGTAAVDGFNFVANSALPLGERTELYLFGGRSFRDTDAFAFSRDGFEDGDNRAVPSLYPDGFTPRITSNIEDLSVSGGVRHDLANGIRTDFSHTFGQNDFNYFVKGSNNASLGDASPTEFNAGGHRLTMNVTGIDASKFFDDVMVGLNVAGGIEYRTENFQIFAGDEASYAIYDSAGVAITNPAVQSPALDANGDVLPGGSQGFPGYSPANEVDRTRTNLGLYADAELNVTRAFLVAGAVRYESYSDFGETVNVKLASRYKVHPTLALRGSVSTGFRAPSLAQIHYNLVFNNIVSGRSLRTLLASNTSTVTRAFGIQPLQEETAVNGSVGFTFEASGFSATVDAYLIDVDDRIILTDNFDATSLNIGVEAAQFFANGVDTQTRGLDVVLGYQRRLGPGRASVGLAGNVNDLEIKRINSGDLNPFTFFGPFSQAYLEAAAPDYKLGLSLAYAVAGVDVQVFLTHFSEVILQDFQWVDAPATNQAEADALFPIATDVYEAATTVDISASYTVTPNVRLTLGANNVFNTYPTPQFDTWTDQGGLTDSVQMGSDGAYIFGRVGVHF